MKTPPAQDWDDPIPADTEESRQALTLLWLAESNPLSAAPEDSLANIRARLELPRPQPLRRTGPWRAAFAAGGWAAAACLALLLWQQHGPSSKTPVPVTAGTPVPGGKGPLPHRERPAPRPAAESVVVQPLTDPAELRRQLAGVRSALTGQGRDNAGIHRPVIRELRPPGAAVPASGQDRVLDLIATALESDLNRRSARPNSREVVIESGWANWASVMPGDVTFRHRQFPASRWQELGLLRSPAGQFFDPASGWLWTPEPGSPDYTGQPAPPDLDRALFAAADSGKSPPSVAASAIATGSAQMPGGYLITGSGGETIVALSGLPELPPGASLYMTAFGSSGELIRYGVNSTGLSTTDGWSFSGVIPAEAGGDFSRGFSLEMQDLSGSSSVILSSGADAR